MFPAERQNQIRTQLAACLAGVVSQRLLPRVGGGLVAAFELLVANNAIRALVREGKTHQIRNVLAAGRAEGMCTLEMWLNQLVANGIDHDARTRWPGSAVPEGQGVDRRRHASRPYALRTQSAIAEVALMTVPWAARRARLDPRRDPRGRRDHGHRDRRALVWRCTAIFTTSAVNRQATTAAVVARDYVEALEGAVTTDTWCCHVVLAVVLAAGRVFGEREHGIVPVGKRVDPAIPDGDDHRHLAQRRTGNHPHGGAQAMTPVSFRRRSPCRGARRRARDGADLPQLDRPRARCAAHLHDDDVDLDRRAPNGAAATTTTRTRR